MTKMLEMHEVELRVDPLTNMPLLVLSDQRGEHSLPIWIGLIEAGAFAPRLEQIELSSPTTHDLVARVLGALDATVTRAEIVDLSADGTYHARLVVHHGGREHEIGCRPSDAVAAAMRADACRILVAADVVERARELARPAPEQALGAQDAAQLRDLLDQLPEELFGRWKM